MIIYYFVKNLISLTGKQNINKIINEHYDNKLFLKWCNIGGQIIPEDELEEIKNDIKFYIEKLD